MKIKTMKFVKSFFPVIILFVGYNALQAQVPVIKEPHHNPVLVNDYVRLLDVHIKPKDTTQYHVHATPSVIVFISNSETGSQKLGESPSAPGKVSAGQLNYVDFGSNPVTHRVFNSGDNDYHVMDIELAKQNPSADSCAALQQSNVQKIINEKLVCVYKYDVAAHQSFNLQKSSCAHLLVCVAGEITASNKKIKTGGYIYFDPNTSINTNNNSGENATCVLLELK